MLPVSFQFVRRPFPDLVRCGGMTRGIFYSTSNLSSHPRLGPRYVSIILWRIIGNVKTRLSSVPMAGSYLAKISSEYITRMKCWSVPPAPPGPGLIDL